MAVCIDNVTDLSITDSQREKGEGASAVKTFICQSTIIPASGRGFHTALSSQSINLAETFLGECDNFRCRSVDELGMFYTAVIAKKIA